MSLLETPPGARVTIDGREFLYFVGTGYLGLQGRREVICAAAAALERYGIGSANSRTAFGTTQPLLDVERRAAELLAAADAFHFASGWMGGNILVRFLGGESVRVFIDECSHYSLMEAALCAAANSTSGPVFFHHRDPTDLLSRLKDNLGPGKKPLVLSDGVFAATGSIAPVDLYCEVLREYPGAALLLDDAHGIAVLGANGRGTFEHFSFPLSLGEGQGAGAPALFSCATLSKAVGGYGGIIAGSRDFIGRIKSQSPYMAGASPPPPPIAAASARAIELVMAEPELRARLWANARLLKDGLRGLGFDVDDTPAPIVCLRIGDSANMQRIQRELMSKGIAIAYMGAYAGLGPEGGLRIAVFATHSDEMIRRLIEELGPRT